MIALDTNAVIAYLRGTPRSLVTRFERALGDENFLLPAISYCELRYGAAKSQRRAENMERLALFLQLPVTVIAFEPGDAEEAGDIRAALERIGRPIGPYDVLIAAQARRRGALLVTANETEFSRVPGLRTENWAAE